jgi:PAS domain S-box-containing protein
MKSPREIFLSFLHPSGPSTRREIAGSGIRAREAVGYILAFTLAVVIVGGFLSWHIASLYQQEMANWRARQTSIADDRAQRISDWLAERQADAQVFAAHPSVRATLRAYDDAGQLSKHPPGSLPELTGAVLLSGVAPGFSPARAALKGGATFKLGQHQLTAVLDEMVKLYSYAGVYVLDRNAQVVAQSSRSIPLNPLFSETCRAVSRSGATGIAVVGDAPNRSLIGFSAPVFPAPGTTDAARAPGQLLGMVLVVSDASQTLFPLVTRDVVPTRTGETLLVRREGNDIVYFSPLRHVPAGSENLRFPLSVAPIAARLALEGRETFAEVNDYRGVPALAGTQRIPLTGWGLVRKIDRAEALADFRRMAIAESLAAGLLIILLGGLLLFLRRVVMTRVVKQQEEKFRALLESAPDAMVVVNQVGEIVLVNLQAEKRFGYRRGELIGKNVKNIISEGFAERLIADALRSVEDALAQEIGSGIELIGRRKDGSDFPIEIMLSPLKSAEGILVTAAIRDITERKDAEEHLVQMESRYRGLLEAAPDAMVVVNQGGEIVLLNLQAEKQFGYRRDELVGKNVKSIIPEGFAERLIADALRSTEDVLAQQIGTGIELTGRRKDGSDFPIEIMLSPLKSAEGILVTTAIRDITERKRAEEALRESGERARIVAESVTDVIYEWDLKDKVEWYGDVDSLMGYPAGGFPRTIDGWVAALHPEDKERVWLAIESQLKGVAPYNVDYRIAEKDGGWRWWSARGTVLRDEQGQPRRWVGAVTDITERKRAEEEIQKLNEQLEERVAERTGQLEASKKEMEAFTYSVSHDLRAPLRHVDGFSKLLIEEHLAELSPDAQEYVATIRDSVLQMGMLIDDLLNLARLGRKQLSTQVTGLNSLAEEVMADLKRANPDRLIEWKVETLPFVECDPALMKQVFANLLSNAVKFTRPRQPAVIELGVTSHDGARAVFVRDNGVGFSMKYANKLFGVFQRLHRAEDFEGTGVGLATVQRIIHKHGGRVWAEAELDKGATFYFTLNARDKEKLETESRNTSGGRSEVA